MTIQRTEKKREVVKVLPKAEPLVEHVDNVQAINEKYRKMSFNESDS